MTGVSKSKYHLELGYKGYEINYMYLINKLHKFKGYK
jgi:hypothetical protein